MRHVTPQVKRMPKRPDIDLFLKRALSKCVMFEGVPADSLQAMVDLGLQLAIGH